MSQQTDELGRPDARVHGGTVELELDSQPNELLEHWALHDTKRLDGLVQVLAADQQAVQNELRFFGACCVGLTKHYQDAHSQRGMTMDLRLSANRLQYGEAELDNRWPGTAA